MWTRLTAALNRRGSARLIARNAWYALTYVSPRRRRLRRSLAAFDRRFGLDTARPQPVGSLGLPAGIAAHAAQYQTIRKLDLYLAGLDIDFRDYTFVDYGCGKGRVLLMASEYPFRSIVGIECAPQLAAVARQNIARYNSPTQSCRDISVVVGNAAEFAPPAGPSIYFLYNPFDDVILAPTLARIAERAVAARPDFMIYVDPVFRACVERTGDWRVIEDHGDWVIYRRAAPRFGS